MPEIYSYQDIPLRRDTIVISERELFFFERCWDWCLENGKTGLDEPNAWIRVRWGWVEDRFNDYLNVSFMINQSDRFHQCSHKLPKSKIVKSIHYSEFQKRPFLVVSDDWFQHSWEASYSAFALVDAIGVKEHIKKHGSIDSKKLKNFNKSVRKLSFRHPDYLFLTFADSTIVKAKWRRAAVTGYVEEYNPEKLLDIANKVSILYKQEMGFSSYIVATQGLLDDSSEKHYNRSLIGNHVSVGSLGTPFANLYEIEKAVRVKIRAKEMAPHQLYLSEDFYLSLRLNYKEKKNVDDVKLEFESILNPGSFNHFVPSSYSEIHEMIDFSKRKTNLRWEISKRVLRPQVYFGKLHLALKAGGIGLLLKVIQNDLKSIIKMYLQ